MLWGLSSWRQHRFNGLNPASDAMKMLMLFLMCLLCSCAEWPPENARVVNNFKKYSSDLEKLGEEFWQSPYTSVSDAGTLDTVKVSMNKNELPYIVKSELEKPIALKLLKLLRQARVFSVYRVEDTTYFLPSILLSGKYSTTALAYVYDGRWQDVEECEEVKGQADVRQCFLRLGDHWSVLYGF